ncbi:uncharacterized protein LOC107976979, partial [Cricetulus griseus]|uniref:uncharacterized protein LOC107976979 n=1 Tax=Cricetulus griseus TaxID=10029 RepID=UPI000F737E16
MGQQLMTLLSLTLNHWGDVRDRANQKKCQTLCNSECPTFNVGWPRDGSFNLEIILQIKEMVFNSRPHGHPDQIPYIITWEDLARNPPPWAALSLSPRLSRNSPPCKPVFASEEWAENSGEAASWSAQLFPLRSVGNQTQYCPFSASDLYNWKTHNPSFSQDPQALTGLIESILMTHQPTWDDCLTTEERQKVFLEAHKNVPGPNGALTQLPNEIDADFPLNRPNWDYTSPAGREQLCLYCQVLLAGLRVAGRHPTNLVKVRAITQGGEKTPSAYLERLMEAYFMYTPFDPASPEHRGEIIMAFIGQSAPDILTKLQRLEGLQDYTLQDLMKEAKKICNKTETLEEKEERLRKMQEEKEER